MNYRSFATFWMRRFRARRLKRLRSLFPNVSTVLDVGGTTSIWDVMCLPAKVTILNSDPKELCQDIRYRTVIGDGRALAFESKSFDLAFSNSVIEHVGGWQDMQRFAAELVRVGRGVYCQTPNRWFPVEPHLGTLFLHYCPKLLRSYFVVRYLTLWGLMNKPSREQAAASVAGIVPLTKRQMRELFPGARMEAEKFLGFTKSLIAVKPDQSQS